MKKSILIGIMTLWWIIPYFIVSLARYPIIEYLTSYYIFFIVFIVTAASYTIFNFIEKKADSWKKAGYWKKYFIINGGYALNMIIIIFITVILSSYIEYFGGEPEGSIGMLYFPSIIFYLLLGLIIGIVVYLKNRVRNKKII